MTIRNGDQVLLDLKNPHALPTAQPPVDALARCPDQTADLTL
jgi:hypothetical protein